MGAGRTGGVEEEESEEEADQEDEVGGVWLCNKIWCKGTMTAPECVLQNETDEN